MILDIAQKADFITVCTSPYFIEQNRALEVFRDSLMFNYGDKNLVRLTGQEYQFLEKFAPFINHKNYETLINEFNQIRQVIFQII